MYERNAIVLERYFNEIFDFKGNNNLRKNYLNYRKLFENYENFCAKSDAESKAEFEFNDASNELSKIQKTQEKLYNKGTKCEYSRYVIFNNIKESPENVRKFLEKVEKDAQKNSDDLKDLGEKFALSLEVYNEKKDALEKCQKEKNKAKSEYEDILEKTRMCAESISNQVIDNAKTFIDSENKDNKKELTEIFLENGKDEKNQFDPDVISNTIINSIAIYKNEIDIYLIGFERTLKLLEEIEIDTVKNDKHRKFYNDSKFKLDFYNAEKAYLVQFLDNERITAIYDKKIHRKLMLEACKNLNADFEQINKLYEIILKEIAGRSTKKIYKENYNKEYLLALEKAPSEVSLDTAKMRANAIALMNLNYWRIEGISRIYDAFEKDVTEIYGRDLSEFATTEEQDTTEEDEDVELVEQPEIIEVQKNDTTNVEKIAKEKQNTKKKSKYGVLKSSKKALANAIYISLQAKELEYNLSQNAESNEKNVAEGEYFDIDKSLDMLENVDIEFDETPKSTEESMLDMYFKEQDKNTQKRKAKDDKKLEREINKKSKSNIFKKIMGVNSRKTSEV